MHRQGWLFRRFEKSLQQGWEICNAQAILAEIEELHIDADAICPSEENIFKAFELLRPEKVKYVILGQDPYWQISKSENQPIATGLAFGVRRIEDVHPSTAIHKILGNIYQHSSDRKRDCTLKSWAEDCGILLLNTALTVPKPKPGQSGQKVSANKHSAHWKIFTEAALKFLKENQQRVGGNHSPTCFAWGVAAERSFQAAGLPFKFSYHPCARVQGPSSFAEFWKEEDVQPLIYPRSA